MINYLLEVEKKLPALLKSLDGWNSKLVVYEKPMVERLWRQDGENRIYLHRIHPCSINEAYYHEHPWPSAMRVLKGSYEMRIGVADKIAGEITLSPKSCYSMSEPKQKHSVRPLETAVLSLMVTGPLYDTKKKVQIPSSPDLPIDMANMLLADFRKFYKPTYGY